MAISCNSGECKNNIKGASLANSASWKLNPPHPVDAKDLDYVGFGQFDVDPNG